MRYCPTTQERWVVMLPVRWLSNRVGFRRQRIREALEVAKLQKRFAASTETSRTYVPNIRVSRVCSVLSSIKNQQVTWNQYALGLQV
jgi:hypothetical protein